MNELLDYLTNIRPLSQALTQRIVKTFQLRQVPKGTYLMREGDTTQRAIFVLSGFLRCYELRGTSEISLHFLLPNDLLIEGLNSDTGGLSTGFIQALAATTILTCPTTNLAHIYAEFPEFEHHGRIIHERRIAQLNLILDGIRMRTARERYLFLQREFPDWVQTVPHKYLATFLGINPITFSKIRSKR